MVSLLLNSTADEARLRWIETLAQQLSIETVNSEADLNADYYLYFSDDRLMLCHRQRAHGPIFVDFLGGANAHRRQFGGGVGQAIAKAVGVSSKFKPSVIDATAGLGADGAVLAGLGCSVSFIERNPIVYALLADGIERAVLQCTDTIGQMRCIYSNAHGYLSQLEEPCDVIYLDPMFPERKKKSAKVNKGMQAFHSIVGDDADASILLPLALTKARYRVVVKRPAHAPWLNHQKPSLEKLGKSTRFDIYTLKRMPS